MGRGTEGLRSDGKEAGREWKGCGLVGGGGKKAEGEGKEGLRRDGKAAGKEEEGLGWEGSGREWMGRAAKRWEGRREESGWGKAAECSKKGWEGGGTAVTVRGRERKG